MLISVCSKLTRHHGTPPTPCAVTATLRAKTPPRANRDEISVGPRGPVAVQNAMSENRTWRSLGEVQVDSRYASTGHCIASLKGHSGHVPGAWHVPPSRRGVSSSAEHIW
eukprot:2443867-Rhodomonas_salina.2